MMGYCKDLEAAAKLPENIYYVIITQLIACSNEKFHHEFIQERVKIRKQVMAYFGKGQATIQALQIREGYYTYKSLLELAIESYQSLFDTNE
jgi:hypothetical protein